MQKSANVTVFYIGSVFFAEIAGNVVRLKSNLIAVIPEFLAFF